MTSDPSTTKISIIRHGQSLHNVDRSHSGFDPPLTAKGEDDAKLIELQPAGLDKENQNQPDLILISPMTRTIQTAMLAFPTIFESHPFKTEVRIWPDLREAHDANCNKGMSRADLTQKFPGFDFSNLPSEWNYAPHTSEDATVRAETVRSRLRDLCMSGRYKNIAVFTHRGFIAFLVKGERFDVCEVRPFRLASVEEAEDGALRFGTNVDTGSFQDFGPTLLVPFSSTDNARKEADGF